MLELTSAELKDDLGVVSFGDRRRLMLGVTILKAKEERGQVIGGVDEKATADKAVEVEVEAIGDSADTGDDAGGQAVDGGGEGSCSIDSASSACGDAGVGGANGANAANYAGVAKEEEIDVMKDNEGETWPGAMPPVVVMNSNTNGKDVMGAPVISRLMVFADKSDAGYGALWSTLQKVGSKFKGKLLTIVVPKSEREKRAYDYFGAAKKDLPMVSMFNVEAGGQARFKSVLLEETCMPYCKGVDYDRKTQSFADLSAFVSANVKEPVAVVAEKAMDGSVHVVTAGNFDALVMQSRKDVMLKFYAPWCGHCKQMAPGYEVLAAKFAGSSDVLIAKVDATIHKLETPIEVKGFPTVLFFPGDDKQNPVKYGGGRDSVSLISFIEEHKTSGPAKKQVRKPKKKTVMKKADKTSGTATPAGRATQSEGAVKKTTKKKSSGARMPKDVVSVVTDDNFDQLIT